MCHNKIVDWIVQYGEHCRRQESYLYPITKLRKMTEIAVDKKALDALVVRDGNLQEMVGLR